MLFVAFCLTELIVCSGSAVGQDTSQKRDEKSSTETSVGLWDPVPLSPSTTIPAKIQDGYWRGQFDRVNREVAEANKTKVIFFGDSITLNWSIERGAGKGVWKEFFTKYHPINMGNSGDITPVMLYRVKHGNLAFPDEKQPKVAVLMCGTNNFVVTQSGGGKVKWDLGADCPAEDVAHGVRAIAQEFRRRLPQTRLIVMGILPVVNKAKRAKCRQVNGHLKKIKFDNDEVMFVDLWDKFMNRDRSLNQELFSDGTHLTTAGYRVWATSIAPLIEDIVSKKPDGS